MAVLSGNTGAVGGLQSSMVIYEWQGDFSATALDSTPLGVNDRTHDYGVGDGNGTAAAYISATSSGSANDPTYFTNQKIKAAMTLTCTTGKSYAFNAVISNVRFGVEVDRLQTVTFTWAKDGPLTPTW